MFATLLVATVILSVLSLLPLWRHEAWWVRSLDFPRLQLLVISLLLLFMDAVLLDLSHPSTWGLLVSAMLCLVYHVWWIAPYTRLFPVEVKSAMSSDSQRMLRIMTANVLTPNRNAKALIELVRENTPDILVTLESDAWWQERLDTLEPDYPYTIKCPLDHLFHSDDFTLSRIRRLRGFGSDHFALLTELVFEAGRDLQQSGLKADADDLTWAKVKADEQGVSKSDVPSPGMH